MSILFDSESKIFNITTNNSSYIMKVTIENILCHVFYGKKISGVPNLFDVYDEYAHKNYIPIYNDYKPEITTAEVYQEYPTYGSVDYRTPALKVEYEDGTKITRLEYSSHKIYKGKPKLQGLPSVYLHNDAEGETLEITLNDKYSDMQVILLYTIIEGYDAIIRSSKILNLGKNDIKLYSALSASIDCYNDSYNITYLSGHWARERHIKTVPISNGIFTIDSKKGASSHSFNPFMAISSVAATENDGEVFGYNLIYSGNFVSGVEADDDSVRTFMGINPFDFCWNLCPGDIFQTPEVVLVYSDSGFGEMSRTYHKLYRTHLCRGKYRDTTRPVLINNWEATYFDFNEEKILDIAKKAADCGIELLVLDDGWFGKRNNDNCSLGDWKVNFEKLPSGISGIAKKVNELGLKFGLWFEPEMISKDSDLYREHPDWCIHVPERFRSEARNQLILDLSRKDIQDYIVTSVSDILETANISYVKWDMNRNMTEVGSCFLNQNQQGEVTHRYILGLYDILERITSRFPNVLFESCAGGGGRFDPGMMYYMPQAWVSDDTDAVERLSIQYGTSLVYASSMMGAHVSAVPNHQIGRTTPLEMRGFVAMCGRFGYELDLSKLSDKDIEVIKQQITIYHKYEDIIHKADLYRLLSPFDEDCAAFEYISEDKNTILLFYFNIIGMPNILHRRVKLQGIETNSLYKNIENGEIYSGDVLMNIGILLERNYDNFSKFIVFEKI